MPAQGAELSDDHLLLPHEIASLFRLDAKTVARWAKAGKLTSMRTIGGHRRFRLGDVVDAFIKANPDLANRDAIRQMIILQLSVK